MGLIAAVRTRIDRIDEAAHLHAARDAIGQAVGALNTIEPAVATEPETALKQLEAVSATLEGALTDAEAVVRGWREETARMEAQLRILEARMQACPVPQALLGPSQPSLADLHTHMRRALDMGDADTFHRTAAHLESRMTVQRTRAEFELAQTRVMRLLVRFLRERGYRVKPPIKQRDAMIAEATSPDGQPVRIVIRNEDVVEIDHEGTEPDACRELYERFEGFLVTEANRAVEPQQVVWRNPDRIGKSARPLIPPARTRSR